MACPEKTIMSENSEHDSHSSAASFLGTFALVLMAIVTLFVIDSFLARLDRSANLAEAQRLFEEGSHLAKEGRDDEAAQKFRDALADDRDNRDCQLALARALAKRGEPEQALDQLRDLLRRDANDGATNLAMARLYAQDGHTVDAASYFHRAIYGQWPAPSSPSASDSHAGYGDRLAARFELAGLLVRSGDQKALLAELLPLQDEAPKDLTTEKRIAGLYALAGSPARAVTMYRQMLHTSQDAQKDVEVLSGLAEAEFAIGDYRNAASDYQAALRVQDIPRIRQKLELCSQVLQLDPTQRGIGTKAGFDRSQRLMELALKRFEQCRSVSPSDTDLAEKAQAALKRVVNTTGLDSAMESNIELAEQLWRAPGQACASDMATEPAALVLARIGR
jgi:tetratricopeptide (TPR) repeat protein